MDPSYYFTERNYYKKKLDNLKIKPININFGDIHEGVSTSAEVGYNIIQGPMEIGFFVGGSSMVDREIFIGTNIHFNLPKRIR